MIEFNGQDSPAFDEVTRMNGRGFLYYSGGESGIDMRVTRDGSLQVGNYEGAIPHIGDALFKPGRKRNAAALTMKEYHPELSVASWAMRKSFFIARTACACAPQSRSPYRRSSCARHP